MGTNSIPSAARAVFALAVLVAAPVPAVAAGYRLIGWNNLGMHCMDADFGVLSLLPPFNTIQAQLIDPAGRLVTAPGAIEVTYEAVADADGSINTTSAGKTDFWDHEDALFGVSLPVDSGLAGFPMPGAANVPRAMAFDAAASEFVATGIPISPYDDAGRRNPYPMMKLVARDGSGAVLASTSIVLPVSDEMNCRSCHASGSGSEGLPPSGWVNDADPERDFRLNILRLHDDRRLGLLRFRDALVEAGYNPKGLEATVIEDGRSILCASCHSSEALPGSGLAGIPALTQSIHSSMAGVTDPATGLRLDDASNRSACYTCHPGSKTRCLRGAMGAAVATDGTMAMQCQSCHGHMKDVGAATRTGWLDEPRCDSCHTGTAVRNSGQIRYDSVFRADGLERDAVDATFATNDDAPMAGLSLYRFSKGHGGLECSACHGSTHAEFPSSHAGDNVQSVAAQGHKGVLAECGACHATVPSSATGGPHGLHPIGASWVSRHGDVAESTGVSACRNCHGTDYRGTVLSRAQADRSFSTDFGTRKFWRGATIGCYACHNGPNSESTSSNHAPVVRDAEARTTSTLPVTIPILASDADGNALTLRVVSQPGYGTVGLAAREARYYPDGSFTGDETFTVAAWDGSIDSNLATVTVHVGPMSCAPGCETPAGGCDPRCTSSASRDAFVAAPRAMALRIAPQAASAQRSIAVTVQNMDPTGSDPGPLHLAVLDGDCPAGTVAAGPAFAGGGPVVVLAPGQTASASVTVRASASAFTTPSARAPSRCHLLLRVVAVDATDPVPSNNDAPLELSVLDANDRPTEPGPDVFLASVQPVSFELAAGIDRLARLRVPKVVFAAGSATTPAEVKVTADDGTCPAGTVGIVDLDPASNGAQDTVTLLPGARAKGRLGVVVTNSRFSTPDSPLRCIARVTATYTGDGGEVTNDVTEFAVTVLDRNEQ